MDEHESSNTTEHEIPVRNESTIKQDDSADELSRVESEREVMAPQPTGTTIDNQHTISDQVTQTQLDRSSAALACEKTKRRSRPGLVLLLCLLMALVGAAAGILVYKGYFEKQTSTTTTSAPVATTAPATSVDTQSASTIVTSAKSSLKGTVVPVTIDSDGFATTTDNMSAYSVPYYQPAGYAFYTTPKTYEGVETASSSQATSDADIAAIHRLLATNNLSATATNFDPENKITISSDYFGSNTICRDKQSTLDYKQGKYQVSIACANVSSYVDNAKSLAPLYTVYKAAHKDIDQPGLLFGKVVTASSKTTGYQTAQTTTGSVYAPAGGSVAFFYQTPDKTWHYFTNTQSVLQCSDYNTADLKKAYLGQQCGAADGKMATVSL